MRREATAMDVRRNLGKLLNQVQHHSDSIVVTRNGKPAAALVDFVLYERFLRLRKTFAAFTDKLGQTYAGVPAETVEAEINAAIRRIRRRRAE